MKKLFTLCAVSLLSLTSFSQMRITEWMYDGNNAEFVEFTNVGTTTISMSGWSFDDNSRQPGSQSLSGYGVVQPGESVVFAEAATATFRSAWNLCPGIKIIGGNANNLGRADEINLYDGTNTLVDRLTFDDQGSGAVKGPRTQNKSAWVPLSALAANTASAWVLSSVNDSEGSFTSSGGDVGSPGKSTRATVSYSPCNVVIGAPTISLDVVNTNNFLDGGITVAPLSPFGLSGVINDPTDPAKNFGLNFTIGDPSVPVANLTVTASSSDLTVLPVANMTLTGSGASRNIKIAGQAVGYSNISLFVYNGSSTSTYVIGYAVSVAASTPSSTLWHTGSSDASDAIAIDDNYYIVADDELDILSVYSRTASGLPLKTYDYSGNLSLPDPGNPEVDVEAAIRSVANTNNIYWLGSMSNGKGPSFDDKPNRNRIFKMSVSGTGTATAFSPLGYYGNLRARLLAWGDANGYNFTASAAAGVDSKAINGLAAEGMVFGPDNTTLYIGLRAPLVPTANRTKAVIAPIQNFESWFNNGAPSGNPTFGSPIELNLGNKGIRDMMRLSNGTYIIIAGNYSGSPVTGAIYKWTGNAADAPVLVNSAASNSLAMEGVMQVNVSGVLSTTKLQVISDGGDEILYNDGQSAKDLGDLNLRKFRSDNLTGLDLCNLSATIAVTGSTAFCAGGSVTLTANAGMSSYLWSNGATTSSIVVSTAGNYTVAITDISGCTATSSPKTITVNASPSASITLDGAKDFCSGSSRILTASNANSYLWSNGATTSSINVSATGTYSVKLTGANTCTSVASVSVQAHNNVSAPGAIAADQDHCGPFQPALFTSSANASADPNETVFYQWLKSNVDVINTYGNPYWQAIPGATLAAYQADSVYQSTFFVRCSRTEFCTFLGYTTESEILDVYVNTPPTASVAVSGGTAFCSGNSATLTTNAGMASYLWSNGATTQSIVVSASGNYSAAITDTNGCTASSGSITISVNLPSTSVTTITACNSYVWNAATYTASGIYTYSTQNAIGCDSIASLYLTINNQVTSTLTQTACNHFTWNSTTYTATGVYTYSAQTVNGYDSIATLNLAIYDAVNSTLTQTACNSFVWNSNTYTATGVYTYSTQNVNGCDSLATLNLTIYNSVNSTLTQTVCNSFTWNAITYTASGVYTYTTQNANGCDSLATLDLTIYTASNSVSTQTACGSYVWNATTYTASGVYTYSTQNINGCDSIATLNLTVFTLPLATTIPANTATFCSSSSVLIEALTANVSYAWSNGATTSTVNISDGGFIRYRLPTQTDVPVAALLQLLIACRPILTGMA